MRKIFIGFATILALCGASCRVIPEDKSTYAASAGHSTIALGGCSSEFSRGWAECLVEKTPELKLPTLKFVTTNSAEWAVSDCQNGIYQTGSIDQAGLVEVDLQGLHRQLFDTGICILKIETVEHFPDPKSKSQLRSLFLRGGFFIEAVDPGYFPTPSNDVIAWCVKVARTTKGRTKVENCTK